MILPLNPIKSLHKYNYYYYYYKISQKKVYKTFHIRPTNDYFNLIIIIIRNRQEQKTEI